MIDIEKLNLKSEINFISSNQTIYVSNVEEAETITLPDVLINLLDNQSFKKIIVKTKLSNEKLFIEKGFYREAYIPDYFDTGDGCCYLSYIHNITTFVNGEYRYIKNRLLELLELSDENKTDIDELNFSEIKINKSEISKLLDNLTYPVISDLRKNSNNKIFDNSIKIFGLKEDSKNTPQMLCYKQENSGVMEILKISPEEPSAVATLLSYCEKYSKENGIKLIHTLSDIEIPAQNYALKEKAFNYGGTLISKTQDGKPNRNFNVWFKKI